MRFSSSKSQETRIDLTPMIDIVFLLLIFFMISTTFIVAPGIKVKLPKTTSQEVSEEKAEINLVVTENGKIYLGEREIEEKELSREFRAAYENDQDTTVILRADQSTTHGRVVRVMDLARRAKLSRLAIATDPYVKGASPD